MQPENERQLRNRSTLRAPDYYGPAVAYCSVIEPQTYEVAVKSAESKNWQSAMKEEMIALANNNTWCLVPLPENTKTLDNKWVYRVKTDADGNVIRFKARLVARGFNQEKDIDFTETFAPVVRYDSIRLLLALAAEHSLEIAQFDVQTAFLYGDLTEDIYMKQPSGFEDRDFPDYVCKLNKSLYGLKQSPRCWNTKFVNFLNQFKFKQLKSDPCVFLGMFENYEVYLALYVDDGLVLSESNSAINKLMFHLEENFKVTTNTESCVKQFVGMQIEHNSVTGTVAVHQKPYINKILERFNMQDANTVAVPAEPGIYLKSLEDMNSCDKSKPYREAVGSLIFLATVSRPDIAYAVNQVSRFLNNWTEEHWKAVKRILRYLKGTMDYKIVYSKSAPASEVKVCGFSDADYAGCVETRKSTSGYVFVCASSPITWASQRQSVVAQSTTEAEYIALAFGTKEALWIKYFLDELGLAQKSIVINVDNQSAIKLAKNSEFHKKTKHIDVRFHFIKDECNKGNIVVKYVESSNQLADIFTKPLSRSVFLNLVRMLKISDT